MMPDIHDDDHFVTLIIPDDADIHVDTALKQTRNALDAFGTQGGVQGVFCQQLQFAFQLFFLLL